jgi:PAS domain S-box-containing protein
MTDDRTPLYNSSITKTYLEFLKKYYPDVDTDSVLAYAGMTRYEVEDSAHWFNQGQMDRFHEILLEKTGNPDIPREAGRFAAYSKASGTIKQYTLGFISPATAYRLLERITPHITRAQTFKTARLGPNRVEVSTFVHPGVKENPAQCENRMGQLETIAKVFTNQFASIEHPTCVHRNGDRCRYIISWEEMPSLSWKRVRNYFFVSGGLIALLLLFFLPLADWGLSAALFVSMGFGLSCVAGHLENKGLRKTLENQGDAARDHLEEINIRYNNALLVQEIGQATSKILDIDKLITTVVSVMKKHLDFDRGMILLANEEKTRLLCRAGYGYQREEEDFLKGTEFNLDIPESKGVFVRAFREQKPFLVNDVSEIEWDFSRRSLEMVRKMEVRALVVAPIVYEDESLGILAVDNVKSSRPLTKSDLSVLMGVASQTAISIVNAMSFQKLQESGKEYRDLVEGANSIIMRRDPHGNITFFNEYAQRFFGYTEEEILGRNVIGTIVPEADSAGRDLTAMIQNISLHPGRYMANENENIRRNGERVWVTWTNKAIYNNDGTLKEILCIGNDVSEQKKAEQEKKDLEARLQRAQKMEAIGTLAGGVAHDLNNILSGLVSYPELILMDLPEESPLRKPLQTIQKSGEKAAAIVQDLLTLARRGVATTEIMNLNDIVSEYLKSPEYESLRLYYPGFQVEERFEEKLLNVLGSPVHLSKTIQNLVLNAVEAMPNGGKISIFTENRYVDRPIRGYDDVEEGDYVILTVSDTGMGISPGDKERIFEPFYTKKEMGRSGTGLGMAVVWGTVKDHKGYIDLESVEGKGTTFTLYFPVSRQERARDEPALTLGDYMGRGESILVVDDVEEQREIASIMLKRLGYSASAVSSGEEAVQHMKERSADVLIIDMIMEPGIDGLETYRRILTLHPGQTAIIASGFSETNRVKEAQRLGAGTYLKKPYTLEKLGLALKRELNR